MLENLHHGIVQESIVQASRSKAGSQRAPLSFPEQKKRGGVRGGDPDYPIGLHLMRYGSVTVSQGVSKIHLSHGGMEY